MNIHIKKFFILFFLSGIIADCSYIIGQYAPAVIPPSPQSSNLGKYVETPVGNYTGVPNISIPLWEGSSGSVKVPISLSYHASGVKVEEIAGWTGLGWTLSVGGSITRTIVGLADELTFKNSGTRPLIPYDIIGDPDYAPGSPPQLITDVLNKVEDIEPDVYNFSVPGYSGKFVIENDGNVLLIPKQPIKILPNWSNDTWIIKTPDGNIYTFSSTTCKTTAVSKNSSGSRTEVLNMKPTSWYLTTITDANGQNTVSFTYTNYFDSIPAIQYDLSASQSLQYSLYDPSGPVENTPIQYTEFYSEDKRLEQITFSNGNIVKLYASDVDGLQIRLDSIRVNYSNKLIKKFAFGYDKFNKVSGGQDRLKLISLTEVGTSTSNKPYLFYYNEQSLPDRLSLAQDCWGYYNGKNSNTSLTPTQTIEDGSNHFAGYINLNLELSVLNNPYLYDLDYVPGMTNSRITIEGSDKEMDETYLQAGILNKIVYPTGGYVEYSYEPNRAGYIGSAKIKMKEFDDQFATVMCPEGQTSQSIDFSINCGQAIKILYEFASTTAPNTIYYGLRSKVRLLNSSSTVIWEKVFHSYDEYNNGWYSASGYEYVNNTSGPYPATYTLVSIPYTNNGVADIARISAKYVQITDTLNDVYAGGLRIKRIDYKENINATPIATEFTYEIEDGTETRSSGVLQSIPFFSRFYYPQFIPVIVSGGSQNGIVEISSSSQMPLATTQGSFVGYRKVSVSNSGLGTTEYYYTSGYEYPDKLIQQYPFHLNILNQNHPMCIFDYKRGLITEKIVKDNNGLIKLHETYEYNPIENQFLYDPLYGESLPVLRVTREYQSRIFFGHFHYLTDWNFPISKTTSTYSSSGNNELIATITETYHYDNQTHMQQSRSTLVGSDGVKSINHTLYPDDYTNTSGFIKEMKDKNIIKPIESVKYLTDASNNTIITSGEVNTYKTSSYCGFLDKKYILKTASPIPKAQFKLSSKASVNALLPDEGQSTAFSISNIDSHYPQTAPDLVIDQYDIKGNLLQYHKNLDINQSFYWCYNYNYPVIKAENITRTELNSLVSTSLSGTGFSDLNTLLNSITSFPNTSWNTFNQNLRNNASAAMITTYTFKPLVGMTSETDQSGSTTYYEYDNLGRLQYIKNIEGTIVKEYKYHFKD